MDIGQETDTMDFKAAGLERDNAIIAAVRRQGILTADLIQLALSRETFDLPGQSRSALLNRLTILSKRGYIYALGRARTGHVAYGIHKRKGGQHQIEHDLLASRFGAYLDLTGEPVENLVSDQAELRETAKQEQWPMVPDRTFTLKGTRYFLEADRDTESDIRILAKMEAYRKYLRAERQKREMLEKLGEKVSTFIRVLWICPTEKRAEKLRSLMEGNLHRVVSETGYIGNREKILKLIL